ncbi:MAG: dihydrolipoyl dehydrogenase family protein [Candidatus Eutrophobiaceae bacterium]
MKYEYNLVVIGGGSAGLVSALIATSVKAKVALIERERMGGDCLNTGCVPSKTLIKSAKVAHLLREAERFGMEPVSCKPNYARIRQRIQAAIARIEPHDSSQRFTSLGVDCIQGDAHIDGAHTVSVGNRQLSARHIIVATGAQPYIPAISGLDGLPYLHSGNFWDLEELPKDLMILGAGAIGCEFAQSLTRLGCRVTLIEMSPRVLSNEDEDASASVESKLRAEGVDVHCNMKAMESRKIAAGIELRCHDKQGQTAIFSGERLFLALGRKANSGALGLEELGVSLNPNGSIAVDAYLRTKQPSILACGDVVGPYQFTHVAAHQAWHASINALFGSPLRRFKVDYSVIPWAVFTDPELARVGLSEREARKQGIAFETTVFPLEKSDRAIAEGETEGWVKVLTPPRKDRILGACIFAPQAGELICTWSHAIKQGFGLNRILSTVYAYPTLSETGKSLAGQWKRRHAPQSIMPWLTRFHAWRR